MTHETYSNDYLDEPSLQEGSPRKSEKLLQGMATGITLVIVMTLGIVGGLWWQQTDSQHVKNSPKKPMSFMDCVLWLTGSEKTWDGMQAEQDRWHHDFVTEMEWKQKDFIGELQRDQRKLQRAIESQYQVRK